MLLAVALCGVLAAGVLADGKNAKPADNGKSDPGKRAADSRDGRSYQSDKSSASEPAYRPGSSDKGTASYGSRPREGKDSQWQPRPENRPENRPPAKPDVKPEARPEPTVHSWPGNGDKSSARPPRDYNGNTNSQGYTYGQDRDREREYRQEVETRGKHDINYRPGRQDYDPSYAKRSKYPPIDKSNSQWSYYGSIGYRPPIYRGGYYYYSAGPYNRPCSYGHWVFGSNDPKTYRRSVYFHFGLFQYVEALQVHPVSYRVPGYCDRRVVLERDRYYLEGARVYGLETVLNDIRDAWIDSSPRLLDDHVDAMQMIAVILDGKYDYSITGDDYSRMTVDAIDQLDTVSFTWEQVRQRTNGDFTAFGRHTYYDSSNRRQTTYVSYTLRKIGADYVIVEVGSSDRPLI